MKINELKVGDTVLVCRGELTEPKPVDRITQTLIVVDGSKFRRNTDVYSIRIGSTGYHRTHIRIPKEGEIEALKKENKRLLLVSRMRHDIDWRKLDLATLEQIAALLPEEKK